MSKKFGGAKPKPAKFGAKEPSAPVDPQRLPPQFSFEYMRSGNGYSVACCDDDHRSSLISQLFKLTNLTWTEIQNAPRHGMGSEKIARNAFNVAIPKNISEDVDFLALRYRGLHPVIGFRDGRVFNIVFIDHTMDAYPHS